jgi:serine/threonine-protein kinase RsbW
VIKQSRSCGISTLGYIMKKTFAAENSQIRIIINEIKLFAENLGCSTNSLNIIHIISDEVLSNILKYAYPQDKGVIEIECKTDNNSLNIIFTDFGIPFNPLEFKKEDSEFFTPGMQGIKIIKKFTDKIEYFREKNANKLIIGLNLNCK